MLVLIKDKNGKPMIINSETVALIMPHESGTMKSKIVINGVDRVMAEQFSIQSVDEIYQCFQVSTPTEMNRTTQPKKAEKN